MTEEAIYHPVHDGDYVIPTVATEAALNRPGNSGDSLV
jgi:hypothetical protein